MGLQLPTVLTHFTDRMLLEPSAQYGNIYIFVCMEIPESLQIETSPKKALFESGLAVILQSLPGHESKSSDFP